MLISAEGEFIEWHNHYANGNVAFSNPDDGLLLHAVEVNKDRHPVGSKYIWPHMAPEESYQNELSTKVFVLHEKRILIGGDGSINYIFRVRSVRDEKTGKLISALYGKIREDIVIDMNKNGFFLKFTYYLNPNENDRNLEFDPEKNLFFYKDGSFIQPWRYPRKHPALKNFKERWYGEFGKFRP